MASAILRNQKKRHVLVRSIDGIRRTAHLQFRHNIPHAVDSNKFRLAQGDKDFLRSGCHLRNQRRPKLRNIRAGDGVLPCHLLFIRAGDGADRRGGITIGHKTEQTSYNPA